jgi:hypothetical protein
MLKRKIDDACGSQLALSQATVVLQRIWRTLFRFRRSKIYIKHQRLPDMGITSAFAQSIGSEFNSF